MSARKVLINRDDFERLYAEAASAATSYDRRARLHKIRERVDADPTVVGETAGEDPKRLYSAIALDEAQPPHVRNHDLAQALYRLAEMVNEQTLLVDPGSFTVKVDEVDTWSKQPVQRRVAFGVRTVPLDA